MNVKLLFWLTALLLPTLCLAQEGTPAPAADGQADEEVLNVDPPRPADVPIPDKIPSPDEEPPAVTIRSEDGLTIEEYRQGGQLTMVRVTAKNGMSYTYLDTDGDGRLEGDPKDGPVSPVFFTIYEWE